MRKYQLLLQGIAALCMAQASIAQEKIAVLVPVALDSTAPIEESVKRECDVEGLIGNEVLQRVSQRYTGTVQVQNPGQAGDGFVLKVTITSVFGAGGGAWSGHKAISIRADLLQNSKIVATRDFKRQSGGGAFAGLQGTCPIMDRIAVALGKDVAAWMPSALIALKHAPAQAAQPASQPASQLAPLSGEAGRNRVAAGSSTSVPQPVTGPSSPVTPANLEAQTALAVATRAADSLPADTLPMTGASWQYAYTMRGVGSARYTFGVRVTGVVGSIVHEIITIPSSPERLASVSADSLSLRTLQLPQNQTLVELAPYLHSILAKSEARSWDKLAGYPAGNETLAPWNITVRESGQEEVKVPAGTFKTTIIEVSGRRARTPSAVFGHLVHESGRFRLRVWYAPQVRRYARLQHETWPLSGAPPGVQLVELTSYSAK